MNKSWRVRSKNAASLDEPGEMYLNLLNNTDKTIVMRDGVWQLV
jgi:hypothetical protein